MDDQLARFPRRPRRPPLRQRIRCVDQLSAAHSADRSAQGRGLLQRWLRHRRTQGMGQPRVPLLTTQRPLPTAAAWRRLSQATVRRSAREIDDRDADPKCAGQPAQESNFENMPQGWYAMATLTMKRYTPM